MDRTTVIEAAITALGSALSLPRLAATPVTARWSAPHALVAALWAEEPHIGDLVWGEVSGAWGPVRRLLLCPGPVHDAWVQLADHLLEGGETEEARLVWLQTNACEDDDEAPGLYRRLFPRTPKASRITTARSSLALAEKLLPATKDATTVEALIAALALGEALGEAASDLAHAHRERTRGAVQRTRAFRAEMTSALDALSRRAEPALTDEARLLRARWAELDPQIPPDAPRTSP